MFFLTRNIFCAFRVLRSSVHFLFLLFHWMFWIFVSHVITLPFFRSGVIDTLQTVLSCVILCHPTLHILDIKNCNTCKTNRSCKNKSCRSIPHTAILFIYTCQCNSESVFHFPVSWYVEFNSCK